MAKSDRNAKLEELLHTINHDLRTPLSNIRSATAILLQDLIAPLSAEQRTFIEIIERSTLRLLDQSNRLLLFGQIAFGAEEPEKIALSELLANAKRTLKNSYEIEEAHFTHHGDPQLICQSQTLAALLALLAAGDTKQQSDSPLPPPIVEATDKGSHVHVSVHSRTHAQEVGYSFTELANQIIQLHGGKLEITEENGRKQFILTLPTTPNTD
ncbi:MAG: histidine kinase dimerization/phospho-acceptor domain-containing protein [Chloroflexota bacterium]